MKLKTQYFKVALKPLFWVCAVISRFFTEIKKGKVIEKECSCGQIYKDHKRIEKRYMPVCNNCLPF